MLFTVDRLATWNKQHFAIIIRPRISMQLRYRQLNSIKTFYLFISDILYNFVYHIFHLFVCYVAFEYVPVSSNLS